MIYTIVRQHPTKPIYTGNNIVSLTFLETKPLHGNVPHVDLCIIEKSHYDTVTINISQDPYFGSCYLCFMTWYTEQTQLTKNKSLSVYKSIKDGLLNKVSDGADMV